MEKQQQALAAFLRDDDLPPPYSASASASASNFDFDARYDSKSRDSYSGDSVEDMIISQILDTIKSSLSTIESSRSPPTLVESTFVPATSVGPEWSLSDPGDRTKREITQVFRISVKQDKPAPDPAAPSQSTQQRHRELDEWGRFGDESTADSDDASALWWSDESMARRIAKDLLFEPSTPTRSSTAPSIGSSSSSRTPAMPSQKPGILRTLLDSFNNNPQQVYPPLPGKAPAAPLLPPPPPPPQQKKAGGSTMTVRAEEITFRRENEMGIWESKTGWGIVVRFWPKRQ